MEQKHLERGRDLSHHDLPLHIPHNTRHPPRHVLPSTLAQPRPFPLGSAPLLLQIPGLRWVRRLFLVCGDRGGHAGSCSYWFFGAREGGREWEGADWEVLWGLRGISR